MPAQSVFVVPHTHWDREWYRTFQDYRLRLVDLMDALLDLLDAQPDYRSFLLDGQTVLVDDYLALRPERAEDVRRLARAGRLELGPWYTQPDETLVAGEALMRNLALGRRSAAAYGGSCDCGWLPDTFGHVAQLPQILRTFGIDTFVFTRGLGDEPVCPSGVFWLEAPSGHRVLAVHQFGGYVNGGNLGHPSFWGPVDPRATDLALAAQQCERLLIALDPSAEGRPFAIWNGADHTPPQPGLPAILAHFNRVFPYRSFEQESLRGCLTRLKATAEPLSVAQGELRGSRYQPLLAGVLSARMPLKQANAAAERSLLRGVEPLATLAWLAGADYPHAAIEAAWRLILQNQGHDSICGCHIDRVTDEMLCRYRQAEDLAAALAARAIRALTLAPQPGARSGVYPLLVLNTLPSAGARIVRAIVRVPQLSDDYSIGQRENERPAQVLGSALREYEWLDVALTAGEFLASAPMWRASLAEIDGLGYASHTVERERDAIHLTLWLTERAWADDAAADALVDEVASWPRQTLLRLRARYHEVALAFEADRGGVGGAAHVLREGRAETAVARPVRAGPRSLTNGIIRVDVDDYGRLALTDLASGRVTGALCLLEDAADAGDTYDYAPLPADTPRLLEPRDVRVEALHTGPLLAALRIEARYELPAGLTADRAARSPAVVALPVAVTVQLSAGSPVAAVTIELENAARDHRLRALFRTGRDALALYAGAPFGVEERPVTLTQPAGWHQPRAATRPHASWVGAPAEPGGLVIFTDGLPEHEPLVEDGQVTLAVTLLRCVGSLSRGDLSTRRGHAGPAIPTPSAQCLGPHTFRLGIAPVAADGWAAVPNMAERFLAPPVVAPLAAAQPVDPPFLSLSPECLALSSLQVGDGGTQVVARIWNPTAAPVRGRLEFGRPVQGVTRADATGQSGEALDLARAGQGCDLEFGPAEIVTVLVTP
jgi:hypothetical protein